MPEGDAVRRTADRLDRALAGQVLTGSDLRVPRLATTDLAGATVERTATHGKHLLTRMAMPDGTPLTLHTHLKMEGSWRVIAPGARWPGPAADARVVLRTERVEAIGFRLGLVELLPTAEEASVVGHLGPDLLGAWTDAERDEAVARLTARPERVLGEALLDQTVVAGIGTIWLAESCFVHGVSPVGPVATLRDPARFLDRARKMLQAAMRSGRPLTTGDRRNPVWVYRRQRQPCLRCRTTIEAGQVGEAGRERTTYWCPRCQPAT
ncbi:MULTISPECIES: DNA-formamidopyrimidine glycosylase family protein [unclassified Nocardioides]|uniref:DNA-formamidopyrimidine glycosylase family protein n=1 Tax=unclassified Nocardioides TaxID=2615069 RepID=UPI00115113FD|nr:MULTISPECIES: DNA-formamidopyrimidine glycosylase family protein [unclassified Nocardioides]TQK71546.1 endonuclease-8 [Nocardioides sp. SLBN-35]WGY04265.1 DNA-formamidopyrimidine glycosylase family protein [Nocardioides sp. QY071]